MARRIFLKDSQSDSTVPEGFVSLTNQGGELKTGDSTGFKPVSSTGEKFIAKGDVYEGELVYLNTDGTVSVPGNVEGDDNKADNIIGLFLSDSDDSGKVSVITKGIISLDSFNFIPRTIYYITTDGKLTTTITPYIFGKSLSSDAIMIDISFVQSILNRFGVVPTFDKLVSKTSNDNVLELSWSSQDEISSFQIPEFMENFDYSMSPLQSTASIMLSELVNKYELESGSNFLGIITNVDGKSAEFKFQIVGGTKTKIVYKYFGLGSQYLDGSGIFNDIPYFSGVNVEFILLSDSKWLFGERNILPLRKLFSTEFVEKDDKGSYVLANFTGDIIRLYESGIWSENVSEFNSFKISLFTERRFISGELLNIYKGDFKSEPDSSELIFQLDASKLGTKESPYVAFVRDLKVSISTSDVFVMTLISKVIKEELVLSTLGEPTVVDGKEGKYLLFNPTEVVVPK